MDKHKENGILLVPRNVLKCGEEVDDLKKEVELYNDRITIPYANMGGAYCSLMIQRILILSLL